MATKAATHTGPTASTSTTKPPTLHVKAPDPKPEQRFTVFELDSDDDDDEPMQHFRMVMDDPDTPSDDEDDDADSNGPTHEPDDYAHDLDDGNDVDMTEETSLHPTPSPITAILNAVDAQLRLRIPETTARTRYPHLAYANIDALRRDPFFTTIFRDPDYSVVRFPTGVNSSCLTTDLDRTRSSYLSPESPAIDQPRRRATPRYAPDSPPRELDDNLQDDITYELSTPGSRPAFESSSVPSLFFDPPRPTTPRSPIPTQTLPLPAPPSPPWGIDAPLDDPVVAPAPWTIFAWGGNGNET